MHLNNRCAVTVDDPSEWAKKIAAAGCVMKTALELIDTKSHKSLAFYTFAWHKKPTKAMKHHETLRGCTFTCMSAPGWNDEIPIGRFTGAECFDMAWVSYCRSNKGWPTKSFGWPNSAGFWGKSFTLGLKIGNLHSFYSFVISNLSKYHGYPPFRDQHPHVWTSLWLLLAFFP